MYKRKYIKYKKKYLNKKYLLSVENLKNSQNEYLDKLFSKHQIGINTYLRTEEIDDDHVQLTYGYVLNDCVDKIIDKLEINESDVFYDMGSGIGNVCFKVSLSTGAKSVGYEIDKGRHNTALNINLDFEEMDGMKGKVELNNENFSVLENVENDATIVFADSIMMPNETLKLIENIALQSPNIKYLISMKKMPESSNLEKIYHDECSASWNKSEFNVYKVIKE